MVSISCVAKGQHFLNLAFSDWLDQSDETFLNNLVYTTECKRHLLFYQFDHKTEYFGEKRSYRLSWANLDSIDALVHIFNSFFFFLCVLKLDTQANQTAGRCNKM